MKRIVFGVSVFFILGCQRELELTKYRWSVNQKNLKTEAQPNNIPRADITLKVFDEIIERSTQKVGGAAVESSFYQKISNVSGKTQFVNANFSEANLSKLKPQAELMHLQRFKALETIKRKHLALNNASHIFEPQVVVGGSKDNPQLYYKFEYIPKDSSAVYSMKVSSSYAIESVRRVELCFHEGRSVVFPIGPRFSDLIETVLKPLLGDGTLSSPRVYVSSEDGQKVNAENGEFVFGPDDPRFDHVQAFFYAQKMLSYAETQWDLSLPFPIKIGLRAGYPNKVNTAYYYKGFIRLGDGDGLSYRGIPRDPSIVSHEVAHAIIDSLSGMGTEGESASINEGFADYLTASLWGNPEMGHTAFLKRPFTRTVNNNTHYSEKNGGIYHDSGILSGTFWDIEKLIGAKEAQKLALKTIVRLSSQPTFADVRFAIGDSMANMSMSQDVIRKIQGVLDSRGWPN
ncbi:MAG: hypothetical protein RJB66_1113 [Pseudomonadota bacterium]|jgi:hypothetical protein